MIERKQRDKARSNPFTPFEPALENFVGRQSIRREFEDHLFQISGRRHWLLSGYGGVGKTSLILQLWKIASTQEDVRRGQVHIENIAFIDIGRFTDNPRRIVELMQAVLPGPADWKDKVRLTLRSHFGLTPDATDKDLQREVTRALAKDLLSAFPPNPLKVLSLKSELATGKTVPEARSLEEVWQRFETALKLTREDPSAPVVFLLDQVGKLSEDLLSQEQETFLHHLRVVLEMTANTNVWFVMTVRPERKGKLDHAEPLLFNSAWVDQTKTLHSLSPAESSYVITEPLRKLGLTWPTEAVEAIANTAGGSPYNLQLSGSLLWDYLQNQKLLDKAGALLSARFVRDVLQEKLNDELWNRFSKGEQIILQLIALAAPITETDILRRAASEGLTESVRDTLTSLRRSRFRPVKLITDNDASDGYYVIGHELFEKYIIEEICGEKERDVISIDFQLKAAPRLYDRHGELLSPSVLDSVWSFRSQLKPKGAILDILVISETVHRSPGSYQWVFYAGDQAVRPLIEALDSSNPSLRSGAIAALGVLGAPEAVIPLLGLLTPDRARRTYSSDKRTMWDDLSSVAHALSQIGIPALDGLLELLESDNERTREMAAVALGGIDDPQAIHALKAALNDQSIRVRQAAAEGLETRRDPNLQQLVMLPHVGFTEDTLECHAMRVADVEKLGRIDGCWRVCKTSLTAEGPSKSSLFLIDTSRTITEISCDITPVDPTPADHWKSGVYLGASDTSDQPRVDTPLYIFHADQDGFYEYSPSSRAGRRVQTELDPPPILEGTHNLMIHVNGAHAEYFYNGQLASTFRDNYGFLHAAGISAWVDDNRPFIVEFRNLKVTWSLMSPFLVYADDFEGDTLSAGWILWYGPSHRLPDPPSLCQIYDSQLKLSGRKSQFDYRGGIPTFHPKDRLSWVYRNFSEVIRDDTVYEVRCRVRASKGATCRFLLWVHDNIDDQGSTFELKSPEEPFIPATDWQEIRLSFHGSRKHGARIHLVYVAGQGTIYVDRIELWVVGER